MAQEPPPSWRPGAPAPAGQDPLPWYAALLEALVRERELPAETAALERHASAAVEPARLAEAERQVAAERLEEAQADVAAFRTGLEQARARAPQRDPSRAGDPAPGGEVAFDSADPAQDRLADVLVRHLVRTGYASARAEERGPGRYVYFLSVDWPQLDALAVRLLGPSAAG